MLLDEPIIPRIKRDQLTGDESDLQPPYDLDHENDDVDRRKRPFGSGSYLFRKPYSGAKMARNESPDDSDLVKLYEYLHSMDEKRTIGPWTHLRKWSKVNKRPFGPWTSQISWRNSEGDGVDKRPVVFGNWGMWRKPYTAEAYALPKRPFGSGSWTAGKPLPYGIKRNPDGNEEYEYLVNLMRQASDLHETRNKRPFGSASHKWGNGGRWNTEGLENDLQTEKRPFGPGIMNSKTGYKIIKKPFGSGSFGQI